VGECAWCLDCLPAALTACCCAGQLPVHRYALNKEEHIGNQGIYLGGLGLV
jgi:hypothetical protein